VVDRLALAYVLLRLLYTIFYIYGRHPYTPIAACATLSRALTLSPGSNIVLAKLRTFAWTGSWIVTFALYWKSLRRVHLLE
jgi:uncharacterized MAPEG superfamily protein